MSIQIGSNALSIDAIAARLAADFPAELEDLRLQAPDTVLARCEKARLRDVARRLKAHEELGYGSLNWLAGVDRMTHLESVYHLYSWKTNTYLQLYVALPALDATVDTVSDIWPAADWHEREAWDMFGIRYAGHPDPRRILLRDDFEGHPLRKDYIDTIENHPHV
jgi:NADH-quinone oxidoreductase subunit C